MVYFDRIFIDRVYFDVVCQQDALHYLFKPIRHKPKASLWAEIQENYEGYEVTDTRQIIHAHFKGTRAVSIRRASIPI